jgi:hypothetical protein
MQQTDAMFTAHTRHIAPQAFRPSQPITPAYYAYTLTKEVQRHHAQLPVLRTQNFDDTQDEVYGARESARSHGHYRATAISVGICKEIKQWISPLKR